MTYLVKARLPPEEQRQLDALVAVRGWDPTARLLGLTESVVNQLAYGGRAIPTTVARAVEALRALARKSA